MAQQVNALGALAEKPGLVLTTSHRAAHSQFSLQLQVISRPLALTGSRTCVFHRPENTHIHKTEKPNSQVLWRTPLILSWRWADVDKFEGSLVYMSPRTAGVTSQSIKINKPIN